MNYEQVKLSFLNIFGNKKQKNIWITDMGRTIKCYMLVARMDTSAKSALRASQKTKAAVNASRKMGISEKTVGITM